MGIFPKNLKPRAKSTNSIIPLLFGVAFGAFAYDLGQLSADSDNYRAAAMRFMAGANKNDPVAQNNLGALYLRGRGLRQDYELARVWFERAAENQLASAMFNLGMIYLRGYGVDSDLAQASQWFERAAVAGDHEAQFFIGLHYYHGRGVTQDLESAAKWFRTAADANIVAAQYNLAMMYLRGEAVVQDEIAALALLDKAAARGHELAQLTIAKVHLAHLDDPARAAAATEIFRRLAEGGNSDAQVTLGMLYTFGQGGLTQDYEEGRFWLKMASNQGSGAAQLNLGNIYAEGVGVARDLVKAYAWYAISADHGDPAGQKNRDILANELSAEQIARAKVMATELNDVAATAGDGESEDTPQALETTP